MSLMNKAKNTLDKSVKSVGVVGTVAAVGAGAVAVTSFSPALIAVKCIGAGAVGLHQVWSKDGTEEKR